MPGDHDGGGVGALSFIIMIDETESRSLLRQATIHATLGPVARLEIAFRLSELTRQLALAGLRERFPGKSDAVLLRELIASTAGRSFRPAR